LAQSIVLQADDANFALLRPIFHALREYELNNPDTPVLMGDNEARFLGGAYLALAAYLSHHGSSGLFVSERLQPIIQYIDHYPAADLRVETLAHEFGWSAGHLSRRFNHELGMSPSQYVRESRIAGAADRLATTEESLEHIADACGFADRNHFTRVFSKLMHVSPAAFRKQQLALQYGARSSHRF
jgi:AraC-like DNA-binding protein